MFKSPDNTPLDHHVYSDVKGMLCALYNARAYLDMPMPNSTNDVLEDFYKAAFNYPVFNDLAFDQKQGITKSIYNYFTNHFGITS